MTAVEVTSVEVITFGCRLNVVESDAMRRAALAAGQRRLTIVNTCAVTAEAVRQARQAIRRAKRDDPLGSVAVTGCAAEVEPAVFAAMPEVDRVIGNRVKAEPATWRRPGGWLDPPLPLPAATHTRGFVEIQNGCDHRCTFCIIPFGRGASRSIPPVDVVARITDLIAQGVREVVLTGVDITSYGADLPGRPRLGDLVRHVLRAVPDLVRLRLSSIDCIEADDALIEVIATTPRFMPHLHLSLQSGSDLILKRMKRRHGRAEAVAFCRAIRAVRPDIVFGADLITGFPTETEAQFEDSLSLVEACGLTHLHVFPFSPRPGTPAMRMPQVPALVARDRAARLRAAGDAALARHLEAQVGRRLTVLMERGGRARTPDFTTVRLPEAMAPGALADVLIERHDGRELGGRLAPMERPSAVVRHEQDLGTDAQGGTLSRSNLR